MYTITLTKMNKFTPNNYAAYFGWRGMDFFFHTQAEGLGAYSAGIGGKNSTAIVVGCQVDVVGKFIYLTGNYLLVHEYFAANNLIVGKEFSTNVACVGVSPNATCSYPFTFSVLANYKRFISLRHLKMYRDNDIVNKKVSIQFGLTVINSTDITVDLFFGDGGTVQEFILNIFIVSPLLLDTMVKRKVQLQNYELIPSTPSTLALTTVVFPILRKGFDFNFFIAMRTIYTNLNEFKYIVYADADFTIKSSLHFVGTKVRFRTFIFYGWKCPDKYYFSEAIQACEVCPNNCLQCQPNLLDQVECLLCDMNFQPSTDNLSCICNQTLAGSACDNFAVLGLSDCKNGLRTLSGVDCLFCSAQKFQVATNNQCVCKSGYSDPDGDGTCEETCGDGIFYSSQCDDGNTNSNDGCDSNCFLESGFNCDKNQPTYCTTKTPIVYKIGLIEKIPGENKAKITLKLLNSLSSLPYDIPIDYFKPSNIYVRLFLIDSQSPYQQTEITQMSLLDLTENKEMILDFPYNYTVEKMKAIIKIDYDQTRYSNYVQELKFDLEGVNSPLVYSDNLATYATISIVLCVGTAFSLIGLLVGLCSPKFIGLESLLSLQLIFFSQLLISDPVKWPVGFMYLKYLKFSTGYNDILKLTDYVPYTDDANKMKHLDMKKSLVENFNLNFVILGLSFIVFIVIFTIKYVKESQLIELENKIKEPIQSSQLDKKQVLKKMTEERKFFAYSVSLFKNICEKIFWMVNHFSIWMILPIMASLAAQMVIENELVEFHSPQSLSSDMLSKGPLIAFISLCIIFFICLNNFRNIFLSQQTMKKILLKPEEKTYKQLLIIYLFFIGTLVLFLNNLSFFQIPLSIFVLLFQVIYTVALIIIHPYKQSLRVHSITLMINQCVYIVFLTFINLINMVQQIDEILVIMMGYFITGCCGFLMILTAIRLYYELRYGEALEKQIQKERQQEEKRQKMLEQEKLERMKKNLQLKAKNKLSQKEMERQQNHFLYENQAKDDQAKDLVVWLENRNWQAEEKEKYFFQKFSQKPLDWLQKNSKQEYEKLMEMRKKELLSKREKSVKKNSDHQYMKFKDSMKKEASKNAQIMQKKLKNHQKRIETDINYSMKMMKHGMDKFISPAYKLAD